MKIETKLNNSDYASIAKLFSPVYFDHMANQNEDEIEVLINSFKNYCKDVESFTLKNAYSYFYKLLLKNYKNEYIFKNLIFKDLILKNHKIYDCVSIPEFNVGLSKADLAVFNGTSTVYEIKSDKDSTERLSSQINDYLNFFEFLNVVISERHLKKVKSIIPSQVGILLISGTGRIDIYREAKSNIENITHRGLFNSLRRNEYLSIIQKQFGIVLDTPNTKIFTESYNLFQEINIKEAHFKVVDVLKLRNFKQDHIDLIKKIPDSLKSISLGKRYNKKKCDNILMFLDRNC
ncbi:sce7726 family protein [Chryseobacterium oranimense]|uniref:sce7726 family protein n=1 Tax=Chryseobacterium oranimense TaxID=421058 RepID=UPI00223649F2|nr:sce7726 family protein [Chryseobacterium oranimense]